MLKNIIKRNILHKNSLKHIRFFNDEKLPSVRSNNNYIENYNITIGSKSELKEDRINVTKCNYNLNKYDNRPKKNK
jgi:hypothetical protein